MPVLRRGGREFDPGCGEPRAVQGGGDREIHLVGELPGRIVEAPGPGRATGTDDAQRQLQDRVCGHRPDPEGPGREQPEPGAGAMGHRAQVLEEGVIGERGGAHGPQVRPGEAGRSGAPQGLRTGGVDDEGGGSVEKGREVAGVGMAAPGQDPPEPQPGRFPDVPDDLAADPAGPDDADDLVHAQPVTP